MIEILSRPSIETYIFVTIETEVFIVNLSIAPSWERVLLSLGDCGTNFKLFHFHNTNGRYRGTVL